MLSLSIFWEISDREFHSPATLSFFQSAEADIVCIVANSIRPVTADVVCIVANSIRPVSYIRPLTRILDSPPNSQHFISAFLKLVGSLLNFHTKTSVFQFRNHRI